MLEQELVYVLVMVIVVLDDLQGKVVVEDFLVMVGWILFFVNVGICFVIELCKMCVFIELWDEICCDCYGIQDDRFCCFCYGVQVNLLGLIEQQLENNVYCILLEMLVVMLLKNVCVCVV